MTGYVFEFQGHGQFDPAGKVDVPDAAEHNRQLERAELAALADKPARWTVYIIGSDATTWLGTKIGRVVTRSTHKRFTRYGEPYRMDSVRLGLDNGCEYVGRYGSDWSQACNIRLAK